MRYLNNLLICALIGVATTCALHAQTDIPRLLSYQGVLTDAQGTPLVGEKTLTIGLYDQVSGGNALYSEKHTVDIDARDSGVFAIEIGNGQKVSVQDFITLPFDRQYYVGIQVGSTELTPRTRLTSAPYALHAAVADSLRGFTPPGVPVGTIVAYYGEIREGETVESLKREGWLFCDGEPFDDDDFPQLRALLGNESTPDLRGLFLRGANQNRRGDERGGEFADPGDSRGVNRGPNGPFGHPGSTSGQRIGSVQSDTIQSHRHDVSDRTVDVSEQPHAGEEGWWSFQSGAGLWVNELQTVGGRTVASGGPENRPNNVAINWIIKAR